MEREILFRGKRVDNREWVKGGICQTESWTVIITTTDFLGDLYEAPYCDMEDVEVIPVTVGRYTGLNDKHGVKIYEGDIIKTKKYGKIVGHSNVNDYDIFIVTYEPCMFRLVNKNRGFNLVDDGYSELEVIGNIHDNPKLLEKSPK